MPRSKVVCSELECTETGSTARALHDPFTGRKYYIRLCGGHADEFDSYHMTGEKYSIRKVGDKLGD